MFWARHVFRIDLISGRGVRSQRSFSFSRLTSTSLHFRIAVRVRLRAHASFLGTATELPNIIGCVQTEGTRK